MVSVNCGQSYAELHGSYGEQGEAIMYSVIKCILPPWELELHAKNYAPYSEAAFRHIYLVGDMAVRLIAEDHAGTGMTLSQAWARMTASSDYGYAQFQLDNDQGLDEDDEEMQAQRATVYKVIAAHQRRFTQLKVSRPSGGFIAVFRPNPSHFRACHFYRNVARPSRLLQLRWPSHRWSSPTPVPLQSSE